MSNQSSKLYFISVQYTKVVFGKLIGVYIAETEDVYLCTHLSVASTNMGSCAQQAAC